MDWVLRIFGTQVKEKKRLVWPVFPDYLSISYDYGKIEYLSLFLNAFVILTKNKSTNILRHHI